MYLFTVAGVTHSKWKHEDTVLQVWWHRFSTIVGNILYHRKTSNISRILIGNKIVDNSDVVGASAVGAAPTTSSFST